MTKSLSRLADFNIVIDKGQEESVAQTRSFASMYVAATAFCAKMAGRDDLLEAMGRLPEVGNWVIDNYELYAKSIGENLNFDRFYFLGSGIRYGLACEVNLKMKEMTLTHSEPFHFLEFRHGPMSMVNENAVVVGLLSDANRVHEAKVLSEMKMLGGTVAGLGEAEADVAFGSRHPRTGARRPVSASPAIDGILSFCGERSKSRPSRKFDGGRQIGFVINYGERRGASNPIAVFPVWHAQQRGVAAITTEWRRK